MTTPAHPIPGGLKPGTASALIAVAASQLGYQEGRDPDGNWNNDTAYGVWYEFNRVAWCGIFVSWCAAHAGISTDVIPKYSYTPTGFQWFHYRGQEAPQYQPKAGDIGFVYYYSLGRIGHTFIVEKVIDATHIQTIEGNTNTSGSSQGDGVYRLHRTLNSNLFFGRPKFATEEGGAGSGDPLEGDEVTPEECELIMRKVLGSKDAPGTVLGNDRWLMDAMAVRAKENANLSVKIDKMEAALAEQDARILQRIGSKDAPDTVLGSERWLMDAVDEVRDKP